MQYSYNYVCNAIERLYLLSINNRESSMSSHKNNKYNSTTQLYIANSLKKNLNLRITSFVINPVTTSAATLLDDHLGFHLQVSSTQILCYI